MSLTVDPKTPCLGVLQENGQQKCYLVLSQEELDKGFVRPVRTSYRHLKCGRLTTMDRTIAETYARDPLFYGGTFCCGCGTHFRLVDFDGNRAFAWLDSNLKEDGSFLGE